jgi:hypothetical protein
MALIRCVLVLVTLAAPGVASATLTYDYPNGVLFDSSTNLYWRSGPQNASGWQVATGTASYVLVLRSRSVVLRPPS